MDVEDDLKNVKESDLDIIEELTEEEKRKRERLKKFLVAATGIFLAAITIVYLVPGGYVLNILEGQIESYTINEDFVIDLKDSKQVVFNETVYNELLAMYFAEQRSEFKACLEGYKEVSSYYVTGVYQPEMYSQSFSHVSSELCNKDTIIPLHTHPYKHCTFSLTDIRGLDSVRKVNPDAIIGLMCEPDRFNFYLF